MAEEVAEAKDSLPKETGLVGLDGPLEELDLTKMLAESFEPEEQERSEETSPSGDAVEEAEPVEESTEEAGEEYHYKNKRSRRPLGSNRLRVSSYSVFPNRAFARSLQGERLLVDSRERIELGGLEAAPVGIRQIQDRVQILLDGHPAPAGLDHRLVAHRFNGDDRVEVEQNPGILLGVTGRRSLCQFHEVCHFLFPFFCAD